MNEPLKAATLWWVVNHDRDDAKLRGPYPDSSIAAAVRSEMERSERYEETNLWLISEEHPALEATS